MEKVKNFQRNYLESEKFFSKFSRIFLKGKGGKIFHEILNDRQNSDSGESEKYLTKFLYCILKIFET